MVILSIIWSFPTLPCKITIPRASHPVLLILLLELRLDLSVLYIYILLPISHGTFYHVLHDYFSITAHTFTSQLISMDR